MADPARRLWSTPKFFAIALVVEFAMMFLLNGLLNEVLHLGVPAGAITVAPTLVLLALLPRWRFYAERIAPSRA
jgi:hypothetical protein